MSTQQLTADGRIQIPCDAGRFCKELDRCHRRNTEVDFHGYSLHCSYDILSKEALEARKASSTAREV